MSYSVNARIIWSNAEGADANDLNDLQSQIAVKLSDFLIEPGLNLNPGQTPYSSDDNSFIWSEGIQCLARPGAANNSVTNNIGTIYVATSNAMDPDAATPVVYAIDLTEDALAHTFTPNGSNPYYATLGLTITPAVTNESRRVKDNATRAITTQSIPKHRVFTVTLNVTLGTPAGSPTVPAFSGLPWAIVYVPANNAVPLTTSQVQPKAFPRGVDRHFVSAYQGSTTTGVVNPTGGAVLKGAWIQGLNFVVSSSSGAAGSVAYNPFISGVRQYGAIGIGNAVANTLAAPMGAIPSDATVIGITVYGNKQFSNTETYTLRANSLLGTTIYAGPTVPANSPGNFSFTWSGLTAPAHSNIFIITSNSNGTTIYGAIVVYQEATGGTGTYGFTSDNLDQLITSTGTPPGAFQWLIPIPTTSPGKRLAKVLVNASEIAGTFSLIRFTTFPTTVLTAAQMDSCLSGSTYDLTQLDTPVWCNAGNVSPFVSGAAQWYLAWAPSAANEGIRGAEFIIAG